MNNKIILAIDLMGGDFGPEITIQAASMALQKKKNIHFLFYGIEQEVNPILKNYPNLEGKYEFSHCEVAISMDEKPAEALRRGRKVSSMWQAITAVKEGRADACVSAGNTGCLMAMSKIILRMLADVDRPGIAGIWPSLTGQTIVLDIGASIGATDKHLVNLAVMGSCMYRTIYSTEKPRVGLLNIGIEEVKGLDEIRSAGAMLQDPSFDDLNYIGFVEGNDIGSGNVDVVVTEGYTGNIALKTAEGTARQISTLLRKELSSSFLSKIGYLFAKKAFKNVKTTLDPDRLNGGVLLGLTGLVIKSHGGASAFGFSSAILNAYKMVENNLLVDMQKQLNQINGNPDQN